MELSLPKAIFIHKAIVVSEEARASFHRHHFPGERIVSHYVVSEQEAVVRKTNYTEREGRLLSTGRYR